MNTTEQPAPLQFRASTALYISELELKAKYPSLVEWGSPANVRFMDLFRTLWVPGIDVLAIADLVMIYPPRRAPSAGDRAVPL